jgi:predicted nucleic-acid-binding Zn-ribbon protein
MRDGRCPKCGKQNVYRCQVPGQGGGVSTDSERPWILHMRDVYCWEIVKEWETFLCADCGYFENYLLDKALMAKVIANPKSQVWKKVGS